MANFECSKINFNELMAEAKKAIVDFLYPPKVGIVISYDATFDPNTNWGIGKWKLLPGGYALVSTDSRTNDSGISLTVVGGDTTGGGSEVASTHKVRSRNAGGIPNITGTFTSHAMNNTYSITATGPFYNYGAGMDPAQAANGGDGFTFGFDANRSSKAYGRYSSSSTVVPDHISVNIWYRYE